MTDERRPGVRVLLLEDSELDRELITEALRRGGIECVVNFCDTPASASALLDRSSYDLVLTDHGLPGWDSFAVLKEIGRRGLETPVIVVTGTIGEEQAADCLRQGAADFVLKTNLPRLPFAARRALEDAQARRERSEALEKVRWLSVAVDQGPAAIYITDTIGRIEYVNDRFASVTGYSKDEALGATPRILRSGRTPRLLYERMWATITQGSVWRGELMNRRKDGELYWAQASISPLRGPDGVVTHFVAVQEDVTERRRAEEALRDREEQLRQIADNIREVFFVVASDFQETLFLSPAYEEVWGRSRRSAYEDPRSFIEAIHPEDRGALLASIESIRAGETPGPAEFRVVHPSGETRWVRSDASPVFDEGGQVYRIAGAALDITERRLAEDRLRESEQRFRTLAEASFDAIVVTVGGIVREVNPGFLALLGYEAEEVIGRPAVDFVAPDSKEEAARRIAQGIDGQYDLSLLRAHGQEVRFEATGKTHTMGGEPGRVTALRDVTERRDLESQLRQAQKLEAVGRLAGGVAHDFNNVLTVILTELELLRFDDVGGDDPVLQASLDEIEAASTRAATLTRQLLTFSRRQVVELEVLDPRDVPKGLQRMLHRLIGEDINLEVALADEVSAVEIDRGQLEQVIVNLVVNARDAMPTGGHMRIQVDEVLLDEEYARLHPQSVVGRHALISVSDTGAGMTAEVQARLFEPFFTTKPVGEGTGLGLATSYRIVSDRGGHIAVDSELDVGTTMRVFLPVAEDVALTESAASLHRLDPSVPSSTVLVVEDDGAVRRHVQRALERAGCRVYLASNGSEGLEVVRREGATIDLILTDVVMPEMSGPEFVEHARSLHPGLRVLFTTGYTSEMAVHHRLIDSRDDVLAKPYTLQEFYRKVRTVLERE